jgi:membrane protein DedA with SNARE-associated domain
VTLSGFLIAHGSALILPLSVLEGPIVTVVTGFLSEQGYFDWYWALLLLVCGDLIGDAIYYGIGRTGIVLHPFAGVRDAVTQSLQNKLRQNATRMLFVGKWTHSIGGLVLIGSGMLRLPLGRFLLINLLATIPKSSVLFGFGYFAGDHFSTVERHGVLAGSLAFVAGLASIALILRRTDGAGARR